MSDESRGREKGESRTSEGRDLDLVAKRLRDIQRGKRAKVRWGVSRHTAERAIEAIRLEVTIEEKTPYRRSAKSRRRKRSKRLL